MLPDLLPLEHQNVLHSRGFQKLGHSKCSNLDQQTECVKPKMTKLRMSTGDMYKPYSTCFTWQRVARSVSPLQSGSRSLAKQRLPQLVSKLCLQQEGLEA